MTLMARSFGARLIFESHQPLESCSYALWMPLAYRRSDSDHNHPVVDNRTRVNRFIGSFGSAALVRHSVG
jgi:hypothetical protein